MRTEDQRAQIAQLNDAARLSMGLGSIANGTVGFHALPHADRFSALALIARYSAFDGENDPYGERDFGSVYRLPSGEWTQDRPSDPDAIVTTVLWKIDYYDNSLSAGSDVPWDGAECRRVLTIMLASEY